MTDEQIKKAWEICASEEIRCSECPFDEVCGNFEIKDLLDFINRQQAEIEKLNTVNADMHESLRLACERNKDLQAEINIFKKLLDKAEEKINLWQEEASSVGCANEWLKAEIERLQSILLCFMDEVSKWENKHGLDVSELPLIPIRGESEKIIKQIRAEAIKEFAFRAKSLVHHTVVSSVYGVMLSISENAFDNLVKEMVGESNGN